MNKYLSILALLTASGLIAQQCVEQDPCCCIPEPKCIDCECYTPPFYDFDCMCGFFIDGEFLYWYAREVNLPYALRIATVPNTAFSTNTNFRTVVKEYFHLDADWDPGFRIGIGYTSSCDGWDYYLNWTYFHNSSSSSTGTIDFTPFAPVQDQQAFLNPWVNQSFTGGPNFTTPFFEKVRAKWRITFNQIDLELGRRYWLSRCITMRPYVGLRGAWTRTNFTIKGTLGPTLDGSGNLAQRDSKNRIINKTWGVGFLTGFQPTWYFCRNVCRNFGIYGDFEGALLWGEFSGRPKETFFSIGETDPAQFNVDISNTSKECYFKMHPFIDLAIGLRWEEFWCCNQFLTTLDIGWEHHIWFQHGQYHKSFGNSNFGGTGPGARNYFENSLDTEHNLSYGGLVVRLRGDF